MSIKTFDLPDLEGAYVEYWPHRTARVMGRTHTADRNSLHRFEERLRETVGTRGDNHVVFGILTAKNELTYVWFSDFHVYFGNVVEVYGRRA